MVCSTDDPTDFFDIVAGVLWRNIFVPYLFIICLDYILWMLIDLIKENDLILKKSEYQMIFHWNYDRSKLDRWCNASYKCTYPSWIPTAYTYRARSNLPRFH